MSSRSYTAPLWLPGGNAQTIYPYLLRPVQAVTYRRERWELDDGDFIDTDWLDNPQNQPLVVLFHGLEGNSHSHYALSLMGKVQQLGWRGVVIHFRGCSGTPNRLPRAYHAGDSEEINRLLHQAVTRNIPATTTTPAPVYAVGVSLGGNALLKWLGEQGHQAGKSINAVATLSVPLDLPVAGKTLDTGLNKIYAHNFLITLKQKIHGKLTDFPGLFDAHAVTACRTLYQFDNLVTAPLHGFHGTDDYWHRSSSKPWLKHIQVPTLIINARNDPFMPASALPQATDVSTSVILDFPEQGGHAGFINGPFPGKLTWPPDRIIDFFRSI